MMYIYIYNIYQMMVKIFKVINNFTLLVLSNMLNTQDRKNNILDPT